MTKDELIKAQQALGLSNVAMAKELGIGKTSYHYRRTGQQAIKPLEASHIRRLLAAQGKEPKA